MEAHEGANDVPGNLAHSHEAEVVVEVVDQHGQLIESAIITWNSDDQGCVPLQPFEFSGGKGQQPVGVGHHTIFVTAPGYDIHTEVLDLEKGDRPELRAELAPTKVVIELEQIKILEKVYFETGKAITAVARRWERSRLELSLPWESVWPATSISSIWGLVSRTLAT